MNKRIKGEGGRRWKEGRRERGREEGRSVAATLDASGQAASITKLISVHQ